MTGSRSKTIALRAHAPVRTRRLPPLERAERKFLRFFPDGFRDETYLAWERDYKWEADGEWQAQLGADISDMRPRGMIDIQSFLWVQGSDEYR